MIDSCVNKRKEEHIHLKNMETLNEIFGVSYNDNDERIIKFLKSSPSLRKFQGINYLNHSDFVINNSKSETRLKMTVLAMLKSKIINSNKNNIEFDNENENMLRISETILLNELQFYKIYPNIYPNNPSKNHMINILLTIIPNHPFINNKLYNLDFYSFWEPRFKGIVMLTNKVIGSKCIQTNPKFNFNISKKMKLKILKEYSLIPKCLYRFLRCSLKKEYKCEFSYDKNYLINQYKILKSLDEFENKEMKIEIKNFINTINPNLISKFLDKGGENLKLEIYHDLKRVIYFDKVPTKKYLKNLLLGNCIFFPKSLLNRLSEIHIPNAQYNLRKSYLYTELNLICKHLFKLELGFDINHLPSRKWIKNCIMAITTDSILTLQETYHLSKTQNQIEKIKKNAVSDLITYFNWERFSNFMKNISGSGYFRFAKNCFNKPRIVYSTNDLGENKSKNSFSSDSSSSGDSYNADNDNAGNYDFRQINKEFKNLYNNNKHHDHNQNNMSLLNESLKTNQRSKAFSEMTERVMTNAELNKQNSPNSVYGYKYNFDRDKINADHSKKSSIKSLGNLCKRGYKDFKRSCSNYINKEFELEGNLDNNPLINLSIGKSLSDIFISSDFNQSFDSNRSNFSLMYK